jgi:small subunit ribosomal protein S17
MTAVRNTRRRLTGVVTSDKMAKTITVRVERRFKHAKYGKYVRTHKNYHAHDEKGEARVGDKVDIVSTRPLSKLKRWRLERVAERPALTEDVDLGAPAEATGAEQE